MELPINFSTYTEWSAILTGVFFLLSVLAFILKWGVRFRLVGVTGFMSVLTVGLFALGLGLYQHVAIPGAVRYALVYDNGANQAVIAVKPEVNTEEIESTLRQAAYDLYSPGRLGLGENKLTIRVRTIIHPESGVSIPLYLGQIRRSLAGRQDDQMQIEVFVDNVAQLPEVTPEESEDKIEKN